MSFQDSIVFIDGRFLKGDDARISVWDHALLYGDAVYDTARVYDGFIFRLEDHIDRLFESARGIHLTPPLTKEQMKMSIVETVRRNAVRNAQVRVIMTRGVGKPGLDPTLCPKSTIIISAVEVQPMLGQEPLRLITSSVRKKSPISIDSKIKSINYLDNILAKIEAKEGGFDDAVMLDSNGSVAEATGANIFLVKNGAVVTPPTTSCLAGVTRATIIEIAKELGIGTTEEALTVQDLYSASEVFLTGTGIDGVVPVREIDGRTIGEQCPGAMTNRLSEHYRQVSKTTHLTSVFST